MVQNTKLNLKDSSEEKIVKEFIAFIEKNTNYNEVRKQYIKERNKERKKIIKYVFEDMGYKVKNRQMQVMEVQNIHQVVK